MRPGVARRGCDGAAHVLERLLQIALGALEAPLALVDVLEHAVVLLDELPNLVDLLALVELAALLRARPEHVQVGRAALELADLLVGQKVEELEDEARAVLEPSASLRSCN